MERKATSGIMLAVLLACLVIQNANVGLASSVTTVAVEPHESTGSVGATFTVGIVVTDVPADMGIFAWQFNLTFNPTILSVIGVTEGPFLKQAGITIMPKPVLNNTAGWVIVGASFLSISDSAHGNGTLADVTFTVNSIGQTVMDFDETLTKLLSWNGDYIVKIPRIVKDGFFSSRISCNVDIAPVGLNLRSKGRWITAYIQLPEDYNSEDIDASTILLNGSISPVLDPKYGFVTNSSEYLLDHNSDGILERMVKFDRAIVESWIYQSAGMQSDVSLALTGKLTDGTPFEGTDIAFVFWQGRRAPFKR